MHTISRTHATEEQRKVGRQPWSHAGDGAAMQTHVAGSEGDLDDTTELGELLCGVGLNVGDACGL